MATRVLLFVFFFSQIDLAFASTCGDFVCEDKESILNCYSDCGIHGPPYTPKKQHIIESGGRQRLYSVFVPPCYSPGNKIPVVFNFHGGGGTGEAAEIGIGGMNKKATQECFLAVYPNGVSSIGQPGRRQYWNAGERLDLPFIDTTVDDVGFLAALLTHLENQYSIDPTMVYAIGISNGAWMVQELACRLSGRFAAIASVAGGVSLKSCKPTRPVSLIHFHGTADPGWPFEGGASCFTPALRPPIIETINEWRKLNGCKDEVTIAYQNDEVTCRSYSCMEDTEVRFCKVKDGGHTYPGGYTFPVENIVKWDNHCALGKGRGVGKISKGISALDASWDFFKRHPLRLK